jgi:hypothetical protein
MVSIHGFCIDSCLIITFCYDVPFITLYVPVITPRTALEVRVVRLRLGLGLGLVLGCLVGAAVVGTVDTPPPTSSWHEV